MEDNNLPKFYVFKKRSTCLNLIFGTHLRLVQSTDHVLANRFIDQWNKFEIENQTTHIWDPMTSKTPCYNKKHHMLFQGNMWTMQHSEIRESVIRAANDRDFCTEFPVSLEFILPNGKTCGYTMYFEETRIGEFREKLEKFKKDEQIRQAIDDFRIEHKNNLPPSYNQNQNQHQDVGLMMRRERALMRLRLAKKRAFVQINKETMYQCQGG